MVKKWDICYALLRSVRVYKYFLPLKLEINQIEPNSSKTKY